ncbi:MAG: ABC transporter ATP-binding protein [Leptolyngbyaceae cyanobacterium MO_188.B28]|nr:ABC transporter ATP-binding protein [Leptolyngbyaceae cyanobacterium MO_188.B28]
MTSASDSSLNPRDRPKRANDWRLLSRLIPYINQNKRLLILPLALLLPLSIANALQPILIGQAISLIRQEPTVWFLQDKTLQTGLHLLVLLLLVTVAIRLLLDGWQSYLVQRVGQRITASIRSDLFEHVTSLAVRFFDRTPVGRLITRLTSDVDALGDVFSTGAVGIFSDLFSILVVTVFMFMLQWRLALMLVLMLIPITGLIIYFQQQYRKANYRAREELSQLNSTLQENISGIAVVQLFRRESFNAELFRTTNQRYIKAVDQTIFHDSAVSATLEWIALVAIGGVLWLGGILVLDETLTFGDLASFILFAQKLFDPLRQFADKFTAIQAGFTAIERINDLLSEPVEIRDPEGERGREGAREQGSQKSEVRSQKSEVRSRESRGIQLSDFRRQPVRDLKSKIQNPQAPSPSIRPPQAGAIHFNHVWLAYKTDDYVLQDLNFTIRAGEKVAIVGPTGAGKSSIIRLLSRLYEVSRGEVLLDGIDIRNLPQAELRRRMAMILQDGFLFAGDVKSNISLGEDYPLEAIQAAAEQTNIAPFIEQLPEGYETVLRQRGANLSGGQKQLLAFARATIRNPDILILDEATANLDVGTEALIQEALERLLVNRTAIIIAHRLSTIRNVDRILVLKQGRLVEQGSHEELIRLGGLYSSLYRLQMLGA